MLGGTVCRQERCAVFAPHRGDVDDSTRLSFELQISAKQGQKGLKQAPTECSSFNHVLLRMEDWENPM